jgi:WD40 repeat protein
VNVCGFSPDGLRIVSASLDGMVRVWDAASGDVLHNLEGHTESVWACLFSPDGRWIVTASRDRSVRVWQAASGEMVTSLLLPGPLYSASLHPWEAHMVCGDDGGALYRLALVGIEYGPLIVSAVQHKKVLEVRCMACQQHFVITPGDLGRETVCPNCQVALRVNPTLLADMHFGKKTWQLWKK